MAVEVFIIVLLVLLNGVFAGAEIAVLSVRKTRLTELILKKARGAVAVSWLRNQPERFLATVQIGITVVGTTAAALGGETLAHHVAEQVAKVRFLAPYSKSVGLAAVVVGVSFLGIVVGELVPKSLALRSAERYALVVAPVLRSLASAARPAVWVLTKSSNLVLKLFGDTTSFSEARLSPDEIQELLEEAAKVGSLDAKTSEITSRALDFRNLRAGDVMVPRLNMVCLPASASRQQVIDLYSRHPYARMPVFEGSAENIVGYVSLRDLLEPTLRGESVSLNKIQRTARFVPQTLAAATLLRQMQSERSPISIVVDENGAIAGLVTIEDLVEELVGEIFSEHEPGRPTITKESDGSVILPGIMPIREANRTLDLGLPEPADHSTMGGLCTHLAGMIPTKGTLLKTSEGSILEVLDASPKRVRSVRVQPPDRK